MQKQLRRAAAFLLAFLLAFSPLLENVRVNASEDTENSVAETIDETSEEAAVIEEEPAEVPIEAEAVSDEEIEPEETAEDIKEVVEETPIIEEETPATEEVPEEEGTPAEETVYVEEETLITEETPGEETPTAEEAPVEEAPVEEDANEEEAPAEESVYLPGTYTYIGEGYEVKVSYTKNAKLPVGTELVVTELTEESEQYNWYYDKTEQKVASDENTEIKAVKFFDISFMYEGAPIEPEDMISVTLKTQYEKDAVDSDSLSIVHLSESEEEEPEIIDSDCSISNDEESDAEVTAQFASDSFSVYAIVYTVDFTYNEYTYSIEGESSILLSELLEILGIDAPITDIDTVEYTDETQLAIELQEDGDYLITSLKPFDTNETLTITMKDGTVYVIAVTDAYTYNDGTTVDHIDIGVTASANIKVPLAYGKYYDADGNEILEVKMGQHLSADGVNTQIPITNADLRAAVSNGKITASKGGSAYTNFTAGSSYSTSTGTDPNTGASIDQVRIGGTYPVGTLNNPVTYSVEVDKEVTLTLQYNGQTLYTDKGDTVTVTVTAALISSFTYFDADNECPGIRNHENVNGTVSRGSGMDFILGTSDEQDATVSAIEIVKYLVDENGQRIETQNSYEFNFGVYENTSGDVTAPANWSGATTATVDYSGYTNTRTRTVTTSADGFGVAYDYDVAENAMVYIVETGNPPATITDSNGNTLVYSKTYIETEYVWRDDDGETHSNVRQSNTLQAIPEVVGDYYYIDASGNRISTYDGSNLHNTFLEFYVYNVYKPVTGNLKVSKTVENGGNGYQDKEFTFKIILKDDEGNNVSGTYAAEASDNSITSVTFTSGEATVTLKHGQNILIKSIPVDYTYTVEETSIPAGYSLDSSSGTSGTIAKDTTAEAAFVNTYSATGTASFPVQKVLSVPEGLTGPATWSYTINVAASGNAPVAETMTGTVTNTNATATFGPFTYTAPGTYTYTVTETGTVAGVTNDSAATTGKTVTVEVVDNGDGTLTATADSTEDEPLTFTNTYSVGETTASFPVQKVLSVPEGLEGPATWSYTINVAANDNAPVAETMTGTVTNTNATATFGPFTYTAPGTYTYTVSETGTVDGVTNDTDAAGKIVTVTVVDKGNGTLEATASSTTASPLTFTNTYSVGETTASFPVQKVLSVPDGLNGPATWSYTITVEAEDEAPEAETMTGTVTNTNATATFGPFTYTAPGTYTYTVSETGEVDGVTNDAEAAGKTVTVTVADDGEGHLVATASSTTNNPVTFTNTYNVGSTTAEFPVKKVLSVPEGLEGPATWSYTINVAANDNAPVAETMTGTVSNTTDTVTFGDFTYTAPGTYTYTVTETGTVAGVTNDSAATTGKTVTVEVVDNGDGTLTATADSTEDEPLTFTNTYSVGETTASFPVQKVLSVPEGLEGPEEWEYTISVEAQNGAPTATTMTGTVDQDTDTVTFGPITYTAPGTYTYKVTETGEVDGVTNDAEAESGQTVTVTVVDNGDGTLTATANSTTASPLKFTNTYSVEPTTAEFPVEKILTLPEGMTEEEEWSFDITVAAKEGAPEAKTMKDAVTNEKAIVTFGPFEYTAPGTYKYDVTESGTVKGITNDATATKMVTVTVEDNHDGTMTATVDYTDEKPLTFTNTRDTGDLTVTKTVKSDLATDASEEFEFTVTLDYKGINGKFGDMTFENGVATFTLKGGDSKTATGLPTEMGYTVTETEVADMTTTYEGETGTINSEAVSEAAFTNKRNTADLTISKEVVSDLAADEEATYTFTVTLTGLTEAASNKKYGDVQFKGGVATVEIVGSDSVTISGLPIGVEYTVEEDEPEGFVVEYDNESGELTKDGATATITNTREVGDLTITKTVESVVEDDKTVDFTFTVTLDDTTIEGAYGDMTFAKGVATVTLKDGESKTAKGLPTTVTYTVVETNNPDFETEKTGDTGAIAKTASKAEFTNTRITTDIEVKKIWDDADDVDEFRPAKITVHLMNGETEVGKAELNEENKWTYIFEELPYSEGGKEIVYTVTEDEVAGYTPTIDGLVITNKHIPLTPITDNPLVKKVITGDEPDVKEKFTFTLTAFSNTAGVETMPMPEGADGKVKTITIEAGAKSEFGEMTFSVPGTYVYKIAEVDTGLEGYKYDLSVYTLTYVITKSPEKTQVEKVLTVSKDGKEVELSEYTFENEYTAPTVEVTVKKVWDDGDNKDGIRPDSVTVKLMADGEDTGKVIELSKENNWTYTFTDLKAKKEGKDIEYTVAEKKIDGYMITITGDMKTGYTITNRHIPPEIPETGDTQPIGLWTGIMGAALLGLGAVCFAAKRDKKRRAESGK